MLSNRLALGVLGVAMVAAAAGGSYLATRQNAAHPDALAAAPAPAVADANPAVSEPAATPASPEKTTTAPDTTTPARAAAGTTRTAPTASTASTAKAKTGAKDSVRTPAATMARQAAPAPVILQEPIPSAPSSVDTPAGNDASSQEPVRAAEPEPAPAKTVDEVVVAADSVIGLQMETSITSERARVEDPIDARVIRDVRAGSEIAIPSGSHALGSVMVVDRGGRFKERARVGIRFHTLVLADGTRLPITTETLYRYGDAPANSSAAKIGGGAVGGAILGAILGGAKGAAVGAAAGAGGGAAVVASGDRNVASFPAGQQVTARFLSPVTVTIEK